jgi:hypothetical protein
MAVTRYLGEHHIVFTHNKGATNRSKTIGATINHLRDVPDPGAPFTAVHGGVYLGSDSKASVAAFEEKVLPGVRDVLDDAGVDNDLYIEFGMKNPRNVKGVGGFHYMVDKHPSVPDHVPYHLVALSKDRTDGYTTLHELMHSVREERGWTKPRSLTAYDEIETSLEALAVVDPPTLDELIRKIENGDRGASGYYYFFTDPAAAILYDRVLLTGDVNTSLSVDEAHARVTDRETERATTLYEYAAWSQGRYPAVVPKTLPDSSRRRARLRGSRRTAPSPRRVVRVTVSARVSSRRRAPGAGERLFQALIGRKTIAVHATQGKGVTKADILGYMSKRLGATAVWECRGCRKVRVL